jgi:PhnB protein
MGNKFSIALTCESVEDQDRLFAALGKGGTATMPLHDTFWGARFGMLLDEFGIQWMFNFDHARRET